MISLYILLIAVVVAIFGLFVTIFSYVKKIDRSKRMGHFFLVFGVIVAVIAGLSINKEKQAHQAALEHQEKLRSEQIYDAGLVHISNKKLRIKNGKATATIHVSKDTSINIHSNHEQLHDLNYKPNKGKKDIRVTFVMPGKYSVTATRGQNKIVKKILVLKGTHKKGLESSSQVVTEKSNEEIIEEPTVPVETSTESVTDYGLAEADTANSSEEDDDYVPTWTPEPDVSTNTSITGSTDVTADDDTVATEKSGGEVVGYADDSADISTGINESSAENGNTVQ